MLILGFTEEEDVMARNRIQFQPGMSLFELFECYGTEQQCEAALEQARWSHGFRCPCCGVAEHCVLRTKGRKTFQRNACHLGPPNLADRRHPV